MYEHVLVALDGSPAAERVLEHAEALALAFHSQVTLLRATISAEIVLAQESAGDVTGGQMAPVLDPEPIIDADSESAEDYLKQVADRLRARGIEVTIEHPAGTANAVIVERAEALDVSLILMTTHGRSGLGRAIFGSTADSVLRHASCPVLLVRITDESN
jgi:nucleotide-binding universal stress UspA family protein